MGTDVVFGEIDWNSGDVSDGSGGGQSLKSDFMRLDVGKARVRVMGNPVQFYIHWLDTPDGKKRKVNSPISDQKLVRKLEDAGFKRRPRWLIKVLDRATNEFKLLEIGSQIYNGIKTLYLDEDWGPVTGYDITIERGTPGTQPLYRVTPRPKSPLEASFKDDFQKFNDRVDMNKLTQPASPDSVREVMGWGEGGGASAPASTKAKSDSKGSAKSKPAADDDDFFNFEA
jgi:hypothetical protein